MDIIDVWTGRRASALQRALRLSNDAFADRLGTAVRTVAKWNAEPDLEQLPEMQRALDTLLLRAPDDVKRRFAILLTRKSVIGDGTAAPFPDGHATFIPPTDAETRLATDRHISMALEWLDRSAGWIPGTSRGEVASLLSVANPLEIQDRGHLRGRIGQREIANALTEYYADTCDGFGLYNAHNGIGSISTSVLTRQAWLDLRLPLRTGDDEFRFVQPATPSVVSLDETGARAAVQRLADALATSTLIVNSPLYRLLKIDCEPGHIAGTMTLTDFVAYAMTMDLLENELVDALVDGEPARRGNLPLRDQYMPDTDTVLSFDRRLCVGGPLALCAIARPGRRSRPADYLLLIQERSGRVLNSARRLAVIPKCFHEPLVDYGDDVHLAASLEREMEEELFGRTDVDSTESDQRRADPMHPSRLSAPMRWLVNHPHSNEWRMECTGFGINLVSGNFEFACLIVVENEGWWEQFGGLIEANWESDSLRRYSSLDHELLTTLSHDPTWSNEGLFALLQGFRRLAETGGERVNVPTTEWEL